MEQTSAVAILNYRSGRQDTRKIAWELKALAEKIGVRCDIIRARTPHHVLETAQRLARSEHSTVIAGGGDGTINAVASALIGTRKRLGILPLGTFNYFARELGLPTDFERAFKVCFNGETRLATVGEVNGRMFLNNASIGLYPVILSIREQTYRQWGRHKFGAYWSVLKTLFRARPNLDLRIMADGMTRNFESPLLFIARNSYQLEQFNLPGPRCIAADGFSVFVLRPMTRLQLLKLAFRALTGRLQPFNDFEMFCTTKLRVECSRMHRLLAIDGERIKMLAPLDFMVREHALQIAVPTKEAESVA
jgi:diacylglycerol kinase family enzyme